MTQTKSRLQGMTWQAGITLTYGAVCYLIFVCATVYALGFVGDFFVPKTLDSGRVVSPFQAVLVDVALVSVFALQHSIMARPAFKRWWGRFAPRPIERSTYVLLASLALLLLFWHWQPLPETIWNLRGAAWRFLVFGLYSIGWLIVLLSSFLIDHADLFGLRQVYAFSTTKDNAAPVFKTPALYRLVRHPMMVGFLLAFWATPHMTVGHLLFSLATTAYIVVGIHLEEHDLLASFGETYRRYQRRVRMLVPFPNHDDVRPENRQPRSKAM